MPHEKPYFILFEVKNKNGIEWKDLLEQIKLCHKQIIGIVTKEQFAQVEYKVESET